MKKPDIFKTSLHFSHNGDQLNQDQSILSVPNFEVENEQWVDEMKKEILEFINRPGVTELDTPVIDSFIDAKGNKRLHSLNKLPYLDIATNEFERENYAENSDVNFKIEEVDIDISQLETLKNKYLHS